MISILIIIITVAVDILSLSLSATTTGNGYVKLFPEGGEYSSGDTVYLHPLPDPGYCFSHWNSDTLDKWVGKMCIVLTDTTYTATFRNWVNPLGVPTPTIGISENYEIYDTEVNRNDTLVYQENIDGHYFTHYVDFGTGSDASNKYGSIASPRKTIPDDDTLPPGSVVECHGTYTGGEQVFYSHGTSEQPVFIRGLNDSTFFNFKNKLFARGRYAIVENLTMKDGGAFVFSQSYPTHHVSLRKYEIYNSPNYTSIMITGLQATPGNNLSVLFGTVHNADTVYNIPGPDVDAGAFLANRWANTVWVIENHMYHNNGGPIATAQYGYAIDDCNHFYYSRNHVHHNRQASIGCKIAQHVIISENLSHGHRTSEYQEGNYGPGMAWQYGSQYVWVLNNVIYDAECGVKIGSESIALDPSNQYIIGNLIYDITCDSTEFAAGTAISGRGESPLVVCGNTIFNTKQGIKYNDENSLLRVSENIIMNTYWAPSVYCEASNTKLVLRNNLFFSNLDSPDTVRIQWGGTIRNVNYWNSQDTVGFDNINGNPIFIDTATDNYRISEGSPAIGVGQEDTAYQIFYDTYGIDIRVDGDRKSRGDAWDIGVYEFLNDTSESYFWNIVNDWYSLDTLSGACSTKIACNIWVQDSVLDWSNVDSLIGMSAGDRDTLNLTESTLKMRIKCSTRRIE